MGRRTFIHGQKAGLQQFILKNGFDSAPLAAVTAIRIDVGDVTVYSTAHDDGPIRWNTSETRLGEIMALIPMVSFTTDHEDAAVTITSPAYPDGLVWAEKAIPVGTAAFMGAAGVYTEQCDSCGLWFPVEDLIRQMKIRQVNPGSNYIPWSRFNDDGWEIDTDALGEVSMGRTRWAHTVHPYEGANIEHGAASFWGDGLLVSKIAIDLSGFCNALLRGTFGAHQTTKKPGLDVAFGVYYDFGGGGETKYEFGSWSGVDGRKAWASSDLSAIASEELRELKPYYDVTTHDDQQIWWGEMFRLEKDMIKPDLTTIETQGAAEVKEFNPAFIGSGVACPACYDRMEKQVNEYRPTFDGLDTVDVEDQEL